MELPASAGLLQNQLEWLKDYAGGFWKEFHSIENGIEGILKTYAQPKKEIEIKVEEIKNHEIYGNVIKLTYPKIPVKIYDLIKIIDKDNIIGKVFISLPSLPDFEIGPFTMTNNYPVEFMDNEDHENIFAMHSVNTDLDENPGYWSLRAVKKHLLTPVIKVFNFEKDGDEDSKERTLKDELLKEFYNSDPQGDLQWENKICKVNDNFMVGQLISTPLGNNVSDHQEYIENFSEDGTATKTYVVRYSLATVAGAWIRN